MTIGFTVKDVVHKVIVKYIRAFLPKKENYYFLKAVHQPELDVHGIAAMAAIYNISTNPRVIEEGLNAGFELMHYLVADGYRIKTPIFDLKIRIPGQYKGSETSLPDGIYPVAKMRTGASLRNYLRDKVKVEFDGIESNDGFIATAKDEATGLEDDLVTRGNILTIHGAGIKVESDEANRELVGVFFRPEKGMPVKASIIVVNNPKTLKIVVPSGLTKGTLYRLSVETQSSARNGARLLKRIRDIRSAFMLKAA